MGRVRIEPWTYMSCKGKSTRLFYWREYTVHMFMNVRVQSYVRLFVCMCLFAAQGLWLVCAMARYRTNELGYRSRHTRSGLVFAWRHTSTNPSLADSEPWLRCLTFCLLSTFAMFSTLLGLTEIKNYTISWFDFFAKNISPTIFAFCWFCSINIVFAFFMFCYVKCCKFVLVLQSGSPTLCWDTLQVLVATNYIPSVVLALFLLSRRSILWNINGIVSCRFLAQPLLVRRLWWI